MRHWPIAVMAISLHSQAPAAPGATHAQPGVVQQATEPSAGEDKAATDAQLARFTFWLVVVGGLQLVV